MSIYDEAVAYTRTHQQKFVDSLQDLLRIPSISTLPEHNPDMRRAAEWLAARLRALNFDRIQVLPTARHPVVYGESMDAGPSAPTILFYGHYDVQPVDPIDLWRSDPFDPTIVGENLFARGASDMKGQVVAHLCALEALQHAGALPVNLKFMLEGEEEIGSPSLSAFVHQNKDLLAATFCLNADSGILASDVPSLTVALRGLAYLEIVVEGPSGDLHSGGFGGAVDNPALVLCQVLGRMRDRHGVIQLPGFYDKVRPLSRRDRQELAKLPTDETWWKAQTGVDALSGERGYTSTERATARPTLDVNGLLSGFTGVGSKTVLPARAMAKVSMRLVPDQDPVTIRESFMRFLEANMPATVRWGVEEHAGCRPSVIDIDSAPVRAAAKALQDVWGKPPLYSRTGGSVPVVGHIEDILGVKSLMLGFGLPDDNLHAPNEKQHLPTFHRGIETYIRFYQHIGALGR
jgi:acetylornithine deacetylase/succinyl-diaminopimelate desuccinylase-like protein